MIKFNLKKFYHLSFVDLWLYFHYHDLLYIHIHIHIHIHTYGLSGIWTHEHWIPFRRSNRLSYQARSSTRTQSQLCTDTPISSLCSVFTFHFSLCLCQSPHLLQVKSRRGNPVVAEWIDTHGIQHWRIFRSSYRKLAWVGFETTTTEFRLDALTEWAIRPWVQLAIRANFVQLL